MEKLLTNSLWAGGYFIFVSLFVYVILWFVKRFDPAYNLPHTKWKKYVILGSAFLTAVLVAFWLPAWNCWQRGGAVVLSAYLICASVMDIQTKEVYDFLPYLGAVPGVLYLLYASTDMSIWIALILYCFLQLLFFSRMYGKADAKAFCVCAVYISVGGGGFPAYIYHMSAAFLILGAIQAIRHNISRRGNLKTPVPFLPYIASTIWVILPLLPWF
jgi:prepilin signal peptidase PulO-like enzyme (type II secretory pathway)